MSHPARAAAAAAAAATVLSALAFAATPAAAAPVAHADAVTLHPGQKVRVPVLANDTETTGGTVTVTTPPARGTVSVDAAGRILYTHTPAPPGPGTPEPDSFEYRITAPSGGSAPATVTVTFSTTALRLPTPGLNVPATPPATAWQLVEAFPGISLSNPTTIASLPGDTRRLFVAEQGGIIRLIPEVTAATPQRLTFLDLAATLTGRNLPGMPNEQIRSGGEQGLLGLAFHPAYAQNGHFFVFYSVDQDSAVSSPAFNRLSRFTRSATDPDRADPASELILIEQQDDYSNHNGGCLQFGPDGCLYISLGDEGSQDDAGNNAQLIDKDFFAGILRIDVDKRPGSLEPNPHPNPAYYPNAATRQPDAVKRVNGIAHYGVPPDNAWVSASAGGPWNGQFNGVTVPPQYVRTEFHAVGLRNPWRMAFDIDPDDNQRVNLWVADVGGGAREEVNLVTGGGNYGWAFREGFVNGPKSGQAPAGFDTAHGTRPVYDYRRPGTSGVDPALTGNSVTGGVVYRGTRYQSLQGAYIFADYASGNIWSLRRTGGSTPPTVVRVASKTGIAGFGTDPSNGDVLLAAQDEDRLFRLVTVPANGGGFPATLSDTGLFADLSDLSPSPGVLPYQVNLPFWSDGATKRRWFTLPGPEARMTWSRNGPWTFPAGQIWVKHFDLELTSGDPSSVRRLETRLLVRQPAGGVYGVSYQWNETGTEATLAPDGGVALPLTVTTGGVAENRTWLIPSRAQCLTCHNAPGGLALSGNTLQMNLAGIIPGFPGNQISLLAAHGYFTSAPEPPDILPRHLRPEETDFPVEGRVRSWLDVNCSYCHQQGGTAPASWDGRASLPLAATGLLHGPVSNNGGDPENRLVVPGDPARSVLLSRTAATGGFSRMPPLATTRTDSQAIALLTEWIGTRLPARQDYADWRLEQFGSPGSPEGAPENDPDSDGQTNQAEFLAGTSPRDPTAGLSLLSPSLPTPGTIRLSFSLPADRLAVVETSADLATWLPWNIPGNQGLPHPPGPRFLEAPLPAQSPQYFRLRLQEN